jgi:hypothetical protein
MFGVTFATLYNPYRSKENPSPLPSRCSGIGIITGLAVSLSPVPNGVKNPPIFGRTSGVPGAEEGAESVRRAEDEAYEDVLIVRRFRFTFRMRL